MNLQQFISKYKGKYLEVAGSSNALNQCVDLANGYLREVLGLQIIEWTNAVDFPSRVNPNDFNYIKNTPEGVPEAGDLIIWGGTIGHIAIFVKGDVNWFTSFDQNWPTGSVCHLVDHSYSNVKGWLRAKGGNVSLQKEYDDCRVARDKHWNDLKEMEVMLDDAEEKIEELQKTVSSQAGELRNKDVELKSWIKQSNEAIVKFEVADLARDKWHTLYKASQVNFNDVKTENQVMRTRIAMIESTSFESASTKDLVGEVLRRIFGIEKPLSGA